MRAIAALFSTLLVFGVLIAIGGAIYQAGVAQGVLDAGRVPAGAAVGLVGYGFGWGFHPFGFLGLLFPLFFLFLLFGLIRAAFGFRGRGWSHRHGYGEWRGWDRGSDHGPGGWHEERERRMADLHRRLHEEESRPGPASGSSAEGPASGPAAGSSAS